MAHYKLNIELKKQRNNKLSVKKKFTKVEINELIK